MIQTQLMPSDVLAKLEQRKKMFCLHGEILQLKVNLPRIQYADFAEIYVRSYGNPFFATDLKAYPKSLSSFNLMEFREHYPELYLYSKIDATGDETDFDTIVAIAESLPMGVESKTVNLATTDNLTLNIITNYASYQDKVYTDIFAIDGIVTDVDYKILLKNQTNQQQNGIWQVVTKNNTYVSEFNYQVEDYFIYNGNVYVCTSNFTSTDFISDTGNYQLVDLFQTGFSYVVDDLVVFASSNGTYQIFKCLQDHTSGDFFNGDYWDNGIEVNSYDTWTRSTLLGEITNSQYISVTEGTANINTNWLIEIPPTIYSLYFGGLNSNNIPVVSTTVPLVDIPNILSNQATLKTLSDRVAELYSQKWFPRDWLPKPN